MIGGYKDIFKNPTTKKYKDGTSIVEEFFFPVAEQIRLDVIFNSKGIEILLTLK